MLNFLKFALGNRGVKQSQMHRQVGILVNDIHKHITDRKKNIQFFLAFSDERLFLRFAWLNLAANELLKGCPNFAR